MTSSCLLDVSVLLSGEHSANARETVGVLEVTKRDLHRVLDQPSDLELKGIVINIRHTTMVAHADRSIGDYSVPTRLAA